MNTIVSKNTGSSDGYSAFNGEYLAGGAIDAETFYQTKCEELAEKFSQLATKEAVNRRQNNVKENETVIDYAKQAKDEKIAGALENRTFAFIGAGALAAGGALQIGAAGYSAVKGLNALKQPEETQPTTSGSSLQTENTGPSETSQAGEMSQGEAPLAGQNVVGVNEAPSQNPMSEEGPSSVSSDSRTTSNGNKHAAENTADTEEQNTRDIKRRDSERRNSERRNLEARARDENTISRRTSQDDMASNRVASNETPSAQNPASNEAPNSASSNSRTASNGGKNASEDTSDANKELQRKAERRNIKAQLLGQIGNGLGTLAQAVNQASVAQGNVLQTEHGATAQVDDTTSQMVSGQASLELDYARKEDGDAQNAQQRLSDSTQARVNRNRAIANNT